MNTQEHVMISDDLPGGNIRVLKTEGSGALLGVDLRDTSTDWFYWCFKAVFPHPGRYRFSFDSPDKIGTRGPAVSTNSGREWKWLGAGSSDGTGFNYDAAEGSREAWFCMGLQYLQSDFDRFAEEFLRNAIKKDDSVTVDVKDGDLVFNTSSGAAETAPQAETAPDGE